jgi:cation diffusion facilitator family transporter
MEANQGFREKRLAALASVGTAVVLLSLKIFLSVWTGSLGVLSEALHSGLDLVAAVITYLSLRVSEKPADADHPYGHAKVENFSALVETALLVMTAFYIIIEAFQRLMFGVHNTRPRLLAVGLLGAMVLLDMLRSQNLLRVARKYPSEALRADALHFSTDVLSTSVVLFGVFGLWLGMVFHIPWLRYVDPISALCVAGVILYIGSRLGRRTLDALLDVAPVALQKRIADEVRGVEGVLTADRLRMRRAGQRYFVEVNISLPRTASLEQAHITSTAVEKRIGQIVPADVMVRVEPRARADEPLFETIRAIAQRRGVSIHELSAHHSNSGVFVDLHLEVDEHSTLREAHGIANGLEDEIFQVIGGKGGVNIHIEPQGNRVGGAEDMHDLEHAVQDFINSLAYEFPELKDCHEVHVRSAEHRIIVSCHCAMEGDLIITQIHDVTAALEDRVRAHFPRIFRLTIHPEPVEES